MGKPLTAKSVAGLRPRRVRYVVGDRKVSGLELRVQPDGTKVWTVRYRFRGHQRRLTLGPATRIGLAKARTLAQTELRKVDLGTDPQEQRRAEKIAATEARANSFGALVERYVESLQKRGKREWKEMQRLLTTDVPSWAKRPASSLTRREIREWLDARATQAPIAANRLLEAIRAAYNVGVDAEIVAVNPAARLAKPAAERKRERVLSDDEIRVLWVACDGLEPTMAAFWRLRLLTAQRLAEVRDMEWAELDFPGALWSLPSARTKSGREHLVPLNPQAVALLTALRATVDEHLRTHPKARAPRYVLRGARGARQQREAAATLGIKEWRGHDLRRTSATIMRKAGVPREHVSAVLNHAPQRDATSHYDLYDLLAEKRQALVTLGFVIAATVEDKPSSVLPFARGGA